MLYQNILQQSNKRNSSFHTEISLTDPNPELGDHIESLQGITLTNNNRSIHETIQDSFRDMIAALLYMLARRTRTRISNQLILLFQRQLFKLSKYSAKSYVWSQSTDKLQLKNTEKCFGNRFSNNRYKRGLIRSNERTGYYVADRWFGESQVAIDRIG